MIFHEKFLAVTREMGGKLIIQKTLYKKESKQDTKEFKNAVIKKMMSPSPTSISQLCRESSVPDITRYKWRKDYQNQGDGWHTESF